MIPLAVSYASPSVFESSRDRTLVGLAANAHRPVRMVARVRNPLLFRFTLQTLGSLIWSDDTWLSDDDFRAFTLDPVVTVHPDRVMLEAFTQDQSAYGLVVIERDELDSEGEVACGTTNVDFTAWLHGALGEMRSSRTTTFRVEAGGVEVKTEAAGGRFEQKVELPESWVRGFLDVSVAMAFPGTRVSVKPVDLLAAIRFLAQNKAKVSPRALRYELLPGRDAELVAEPFERRFPLEGATHGYTEPRVIRTWGRRRLRVIEALLPYADRVEIYLKGRAMPSFYAVRMPGYTFVLGLSGWTSSSLTTGSGFAAPPPVAEEPVASALALLRTRFAASVDDLASSASLDKPVAAAALDRLVRRGRAVFDVRDRQYRYRELFATPVDEQKLYPEDPRAQQAEQWLRTGGVEVSEVVSRETRKMRSYKLDGEKVTREVILRDWVAVGRVGDQAEVEVVVSDEGRIVFGRCGCEQFAQFALTKGPCAHLVALERASAARRKDLPTSVQSEPVVEAPALRREEESLDDSGGGGDD
ncbi:MAG TPA: hypothetical protein PLI95_06995 [Polyangiaceae bacterium]|nr:hypothetical protein [Polyangiaceae bacterium]